MRKGEKERKNEKTFCMDKSYSVTELRVRVSIFVCVCPPSHPPHPSLQPISSY